jgi:hypothetical protein
LGIGDTHYVFPPDIGDDPGTVEEDYGKDSALRLGRAFRLRALGREARRGPPVTSEKSTLFIGLTKIVRFCKALNTSFTVSFF